MATLKEQIDEAKERIDRISELAEELEKKEKEIRERIETAETRLRERDTIEESLLRGERITGTTDGTAGTASTHSHTLDREPTIVFITPKSDGTVYLTAKSNSDITVKGSASSLDFVAYLLI